MSQNIVILSGSPRVGANTDMLVDAFRQGAEEAGHRVTLFRVADMNIAGCVGCNGCAPDRGLGCVVRDDMQQVYDAMRPADTLVLASPVYFFSYSAQLKCAIDRFYAMTWDKAAITQAALLLTCGDPSCGAARGTIMSFEQMLNYRKWENAGVITAGAMRSPQAIAGLPVLENARRLGRGI